MDVDEQREYLRRQLMDACVPLVQRAAGRLELDTTDADVCAVVMDLCIGMFNAGIRAGSTEASAQLGERGVDAQISPDRVLLGDDS